MQTRTRGQGKSCWRVAHAPCNYSAIWFLYTPIYTDGNVLGATVIALRLRGTSVLTAWKDGRGNTDDKRIHDRATELSRVLFSQDADLSRIAVTRQQAGDLQNSGVIYAHQRESIGQCADDIALILSLCTYEELRGQIYYVPL